MAKTKNVMTVEEIMIAESDSAKYLDKEIKELTKISKVVIFAILFIDFITTILILPVLEDSHLDLNLFGLAFETENKFLFFLWYLLISSLCVGVVVFIFFYFIKSLQVKKESVNNAYRTMLLTQKLLYSVHNTNKLLSESTDNSDQEKIATTVEKIKKTVSTNPVMPIRDTNKDYIVPVKITKDGSGKTTCPICGTEQPDDRFCCYKCLTPFVNGQPGITYWCSECGFPRPYGDNCPKCGSTSKIINE